MHTNKNEIYKIDSIVTQPIRPTANCNQILYHPRQALGIHSKDYSFRTPHKYRYMYFKSDSEHLRTYSRFSLAKEEAETVKHLRKLLEGNEQEPR